jgi:predicted O-methyltransferase YrrM
MFLGARSLTFSTDYFSHAIPAWQEFFRSLRWDANAPKIVIEIGCYEGRSTLWILDNLLAHPESRIHCIDIFVPTPTNAHPREAFLANVAEHRDKVRLLEEKSFAALTRLYGEGVRADFVYVDGSHQAHDVLGDLVLAFALLRVGGLMVCDDYLWSWEPKGTEDVLHSPKIAIDAFTTIFRRRIDIIQRQPLYQLAFVKVAD